MTAAGLATVPETAMSIVDEPAVEIREPAKVADVDAHEGPVYLDGGLYFTTLPAPDHPVSIKRLDLETGKDEIVRADANGANGMTLAPDGRLLVCEQGSFAEPARISLVDPATGDAETVVDAHRGQPLNSPNDVVVRSDGSIWFTDPSYGFLQDFRPEPSQGDWVYRFDPDSGDLDVVAADFDKPNGLAFSPDEAVLYVGDSGAIHEPDSYDPRRPHHIRVFELFADARRLAYGRLFAYATPGFPDGIKVDAEGRVWASSFKGIDVFDRTGVRVDEIDLPGAVNFTFGGPEGNVLYITTDSAVWAAVTDTKGA